MSDWIEEGQQAPDFELQTDRGEPLRLSAQRGKPVVLYFYPQDDTPAGLASPLKGLEAGADAVLRSGTNGLVYYAGIAFNRAAIPENDTDCFCQSRKFLNDSPASSMSRFGFDSFSTTS